MKKRKGQVQVSDGEKMFSNQIIKIEGNQKKLRILGDPEVNAVVMDTEQVMDRDV